MIRFIFFNVFYRVHVFSNEKYFFLFTIYFCELLFALFVLFFICYNYYKCSAIFGFWAKRKRNYPRKKMNSSVDCLHDEAFRLNAFNVFMRYVLLLSSILFLLFSISMFVLTMKIWWATVSIIIFLISTGIFCLGWMPVFLLICYCYLLLHWGI